MPVQINRLITKILNANNQNIDDVCHVFAVFLFVCGGCCCKGCVDRISFITVCTRYPLITQLQKYLILFRLNIKHSGKYLLKK